MKLPKYFYFRVTAKHHGTEIEVEDASNEDVVEVVRCKDCKHWVGEYRYQEYGRNYKKCEVTPYLRTEETHFCACGERKESDDH